MNPNMTKETEGKYIQTEAARGPQSYLRETGFFYFIFDPASVSSYLKTKLDDMDWGRYPESKKPIEWKNDSRCSYLKNFDKKFQLAELGFHNMFVRHTV